MDKDKVAPLAKRGVTENVAAFVEAARKTPAPARAGAGG